ncbi:PBPRA1643 family SWIM/SEC-C metal-binding motif protein [Aliikangiella sp. IMCC44359]|uniref:PBPRA1643 family SWIM/SEC-C metal-binding motif protein n=1 Tax=Aliikangiella sp. IMCC44359 TaxID=3459125 RepID=UPI00403AA58D
MSKFFYHGKANNNNERGSSSFGGNKSVRLGTVKAPAVLSVKTEERKSELEKVLSNNKWVGNISVDADSEENIRDLEILQNRAVTVKSDKKAKRNDPCPCGSEKKYKKCCGQ